WSGPGGYFPASSCSTESGVATCISTSAPLTFMWAACARRSIAATGPIRSAPCAAPAIRSTTGSARRVDRRSTRPFAGMSRLKLAAGDYILPRRAAFAAPIGGWLIGDARVIGAIGQAGDRIAAAEEEIAAARIADRPPAGLLVQLKQRAALADRNDVVDQLRFGLGLDLIGMRQRGIAADHRTPDAQHVGRRARLARPWRPCARALGAARQAKPMHLADHRVTGDAAEFGRDLTCRKSVRP